MRADGTFIAVEVDDAAAADVELARKLTEACPVDIFAQREGGGWRSSSATSTSASSAASASTPRRMVPSRSSSYMTTTSCSPDRTMHYPVSQR